MYLEKQPPFENKTDLYKCIDCYNNSKTKSVLNAQKDVLIFKKL